MPPARNTEALENRLRRMEAFVATIVPDLSTQNPGAKPAPKPREASGKSDEHDSLRLTTAKPSPEAQVGAPSDDYFLETLVTATGKLVLEGRDKWRYHGNSSYAAFLERMRDELGDWVIGMDKNPLRGNLPVPRFFECVEGSQSLIGKASALPSREVSLELVNSALDDACALDRFVHRPTFDYHFVRIFELDHSDYGAEEFAYLPLLYAVLALGCLFWERKLQDSGFEHAARKGYDLDTRLSRLRMANTHRLEYLIACQQKLDIANCNDLTSLQAIMFMNMFFLCTSRVLNCYSYVGFAVTSSLRMGLHRSIPMNIDLVEKETRKRTFWVIRNMNTYVATVLGLPKSISDEDIDQHMPGEVDDAYIKKEKMLDMAKGLVSLISGSNAFTKLLKIMDKVVHHILSNKGHDWGL
ncbi:MAG: hypothetical protein M1830_000412 [Pleopsidium flavum]|nr:MAG: hypothetical protein M1830_000412 [Pleopsidium flavum]